MHKSKEAIHCVGQSSPSRLWSDGGCVKACLGIHRRSQEAGPRGPGRPGSACRRCRRTRGRGAWGAGARCRSPPHWRSMGAGQHRGADLPRPAGSRPTCGSSRGRGRDWNQRDRPQAASTFSGACLGAFESAMLCPLRPLPWATSISSSRWKALSGPQGRGGSGRVRAQPEERHMIDAADVDQAPDPGRGTA